MYNLNKYPEGEKMLFALHQKRNKNVATFFTHNDQMLLFIPLTVIVLMILDWRLTRRLLRYLNYKLVKALLMT